MAHFRRTLGIRISCVLLAWLFLPWSAALPAAGAAEGDPLRFALGAFDPLSGPLPAGTALVDLRAPGPFLVQFPYPLTGAEAPSVARAGGEVVAYVPYGGFIVVGAPGLGRALRELPGARWVGLMPPSFRLAPGALSADTLTIEYAGGADTLARELTAVHATLL